jgi:hypothetical protein
VVWNPQHKIGQGTDLSDLKIKSGSWEFNSVFRDISVACEWHISPKLFWELDKEEQAIMIAFIDARNAMSYYDQEQTSHPSTPKAPRVKGM